MMLNYQKFEKDFIKSWNSYDIEYLLNFYPDDLVNIHSCEHSRIIKRKEHLKNLKVLKIPGYKSKLMWHGMTT